MLFVGKKKTHFKWLNKICNIQFYSRYKKFFIYLKLYLVSKDSTAKTHRHDILDKVLLPVLLPGTGHQVVIHLDDPPARHLLGAQSLHKCPIE